MPPVAQPVENAPGDPILDGDQTPDPSKLIFGNLAGEFAYGAIFAVWRARERDGGAWGYTPRSRMRNGLADKELQHDRA